MPLNINLPRKNQMIYVRNMRQDLYNENLEALSDNDMFKLYTEVWTYNHTSDKLTFLRFEEDHSGGPYMPSCRFKHRDFEGELLVMNSAYGASFCLNPGPKHRTMTPQELGLDSRDSSFIWECFSQFESKKYNFSHT